MKIEEELGHLSAPRMHVGVVRCSSCSSQMSYYEKIENAKHEFPKYGALVTSNSDPKHVYGFIHGNWSLDNSRRDGRWCGVNNELEILAETGCYADFTMPSAPSETQSKKVNSIYYALDDPDRPKSYNTGIDVEVNKKPSGDLMIIRGTLCLNWRRRKAFILPRIENSNVDSNNRRPQIGWLFG